MTGMPLLTVDGLDVDFGVGTDRNKVLNGVSFSVQRGEKVCILGRSGSGKTQILLAILGLIRGTPGVVAGSIRFTEPTDRAGQGSGGTHDLGGAGDFRDHEGIRGRKIGMIFQHPRDSLVPWERIGRQMEAIRRRWQLPVDRAADAGLLEALGFPQPERVLGAWPNELSGGEAQRVAIALALIPEPALVLADEPTSALDALIRVRVMDLLRDALDRIGAGLILVTHDLALARRSVDRVLVLGEGRIVENRPPAVFFKMDPDRLHAGARELVLAVEQRAGGRKDVPVPGGSS